jgi:hypothetical protein
MTDLDELSGNQAADGTAAAVPPSAKLLLRVVYIMGIVLMLLFVALVGGIIWKSARKVEPAVNAAAPVIELGLRAGQAVKSMSLDGDRLAVDAGSEIIIVDVKKNVVSARISTVPK